MRIRKAALFGEALSGGGGRVLSLPLLLLCQREHTVAHECNVSSIGGPTGDVDGALPAVEGGDRFPRAAVGRHDVQRDMLIERMVRGPDLWGERDENQLLSIGREMGKPVLAFPFRYLFGADFQHKQRWSLPRASARHSAGYRR